MAMINIPTPDLSGANTTEKKVDALLDSYFMLRKELQYGLQNLSAENFTSVFNKTLKGNMGETAQMKFDVEGLEIRFNNLEGDFYSFTQTIDGIESIVSKADGRISSLTQTVNGFDLRVQNVEGNISALTLTVNGFTVRIGNAEGDISTLEQTASTLTTRISDAEGNLSLLTQTSSSLTSRISGVEGDISVIEQTTSGITAAVNNSKLTFDTTGLTIKNGGFKILNPNTVPNLLPAYRNLTVKNAVTNSETIYINQAFSDSQGNALVGRLVIINNKQYQILYAYYSSTQYTYEIEINMPVTISAGTTIYPSENIFTISGEGDLTMVGNLYNAYSNASVIIADGKIEFSSKDVTIGNMINMPKVGSIYGYYDSDSPSYKEKNLIITAVHKLTLTNSIRMSKIDICNWDIEMTCNYIWINGTRCSLKELSTVGGSNKVLAQT